MRTTDHRYIRDRFKIELALRFIRLEARTNTIQLWTGLTADRIRKLYRTHFHEVGLRVPRHRGKSPRQTSFFTRTMRLQNESSSFGGLCALLEVLPPEAGRGPLPAVATLERGHRLCDAYETFLRLIPRTTISFEHAAYFVTSIFKGDELKLATCIDCAGLFVIDRLSLRPERCARCIAGEAAPPTGKGGKLLLA